MNLQPVLPRCAPRISSILQGGAGRSGANIPGRMVGSWAVGHGPELESSKFGNAGVPLREGLNKSRKLSLKVLSNRPSVKGGGGGSTPVLTLDSFFLWRASQNGRAAGSATKYPANICGLWSQAIGNAACQRPLFLQGSESERLEELPR